VRHFTRKDFTHFAAVPAPSLSQFQSSFIFAISVHFNPSCGYL